MVGILIYISDSTHPKIKQKLTGRFWAIHPEEVVTSPEYPVAISELSPLFDLDTVDAASRTTDWVQNQFSAAATTLALLQL